MNTQSVINQAKKISATGNTKQAIVILREIIKQDHNNVDAWLALADIVEKPDQAKQCLDRVLKIDPDNEIARQKLLGEQPDEFDFIFQTKDEPIQEPETTPEPEIELDFSKMVFPNQPTQSDTERASTQNLDNSNVPSTSKQRKDVSKKLPQKRRPPVQKTTKKKEKGLSKIEIVLIAIIAVLCLCVGLLGLAALGRSSALEPEPTDLPEVVTAVIYENIRASNASDFDGYMATIHSKSPVYNRTERELQKAFSDEYTLSYRVSDVYIIEQTNSKAIVHFVLTTRLKSGWINFRDNRVEGEMELRKDDGVWKIYNQEVISVDYLD